MPIGSIPPQGGRSLEPNSQLHNILYPVQLIARRLLSNEQSLKAALIDSDAVFHNSHDGIVAMDSRSKIVFVNDAILKMFGYTSASELIGEPVECLMIEVNAAAHSTYVERHLNGKDVPIMNQLRRINAKSKSGALFPIDIHVFHIKVDNERHYVGFIRDMTEVDMTERQLHQIAYFDKLTGLPNAESFRDFLTNLFASDKVEPHLVAIFGIDHMRTINSTFGFEEGDEIISTVANRLSSEFEETAFLGRLFGDQFVIVSAIEKTSSAEEALTTVGKRIRSLVDAPIQTANARISASITIGSIEIPGLANTSEQVTKHAEMAYGDAKGIARKKHLLLSKTRLDELEFTASLTHRLMDAIQNGEFFIVIQPKIDVRTASCSAGEILVRWKDSQGVFIRPDVFIPAAENAGLIDAIGRFVFLEACAVMVKAREMNTTIPKLAVNASPHQLADPSFITLVESSIQSLSLDARLIEFEMTETAVAERPEQVVQTLKELRALGCSIALDDFGTGHSSLTMLQDIPIDRVKLDKAFIDKLETHENSFSLVENTIRMMRDMGYHVTVEGIERREVHDMLFALGVDEAQGYYYSQPLSPDDYLNFEFKF